MVYGDSGLPNSNTGMSLKLFFDKPNQHATFPDISRYLQTSSRTPCQSRPKLLRRCPRCPSSASSASSPSCWWQRSNLGLESYSSVGKDLESTSLNWDILSLEKYSFHLFSWDTKNKKRGKCSEMSWTKDRQTRRTEDSTTLLYIVLPF